MPLYCYDIKSSYPTSARIQPLPNEKTLWVKIDSLKEIEEYEGFGKFKFKFDINTMYPNLPVQTRDYLMYPLQGVTNCSFAEIKLAIKGGVKIEPLVAYGFAPTDNEIDNSLAKYMTL